MTVQRSKVRSRSTLAVSAPLPIAQSVACTRTCPLPLTKGTSTVQVPRKVSAPSYASTVPLAGASVRLMMVMARSARPSVLLGP